MPGMSNIVFSDQKYPVGTVVSVFPQSGFRPGAAPVGSPGTGAAAVESQTVQADGTLTFTSLVDGTKYLLYAFVESQDRYIEFIKGSVFNAALFPTWKARVAARRAALGTS